MKKIISLITLFFLFYFNTVTYASSNSSNNLKKDFKEYENSITIDKNIIEDLKDGTFIFDKDVDLEILKNQELREYYSFHKKYLDKEYLTKIKKEDISNYYTILSGELVFNQILNIIINPNSFNTISNSVINKIELYSSKIDKNSEYYSYFANGNYYLDIFLVFIDRDRTLLYKQDFYSSKLINSNNKINYVFNNKISIINGKLNFNKEIKDNNSKRISKDGINYYIGKKYIPSNSTANYVLFLPNPSNSNETYLYSYRFIKLNNIFIKKYFNSDLLGKINKTLYGLNFKNYSLDSNGILTIKITSNNELIKNLK